MGNELKHEVGCLFWELPIELCPVCIPVPQSLPAQPELLTADKLAIVFFKQKYSESEWCYMDINIKQKYIEKADSILSLILAEVDKAGKDISLQGCSLETIIEAIKKQLRGEGK